MPGQGFLFVFDGPDRVETVIRFDEVEITKTNIEFYRRVGRPKIETGSIEPDLDAWGDVGPWLRSYALKTPEVTA